MLSHYFLNPVGLQFLNKPHFSKHFPLSWIETQTFGFDFRLFIIQGFQTMIKLKMNMKISDHLDHFRIIDSSVG